MNPFKLKKVSEREKPGTLLKKAREAKGLDLSQIERRLKIRRKYLQALEDENYQILPGEVYAKGFLQKYSQFLGISPSKILALYKKEREIQKKLEGEEVSRLPRPLYSPRIIITPKTLAIFFSIFIFLFAAGYIWYQFSALANPPKLEVNNPSEDIQTKEEVVTIEGKAQQGASVYINNQLITTDENGFFKTLVSLQNGLNILRFVARNEIGKETIIERKILATLKEIVKETEEEKPFPPTESQQTLILKFGPNSVWISIKIDGEEEFQGLMLPGTQKTFKAQQEIILTVGNAGSTEAILNDKNLGKLGKEGEVKKGIKFPQ